MLLRAQATRSQVKRLASQRAHREHAPNDVVGKVPVQRVSSEDRRTPVRGQAVKQSAEMRSALEFFATAQSCRERQAWNEVYLTELMASSAPS